MKSLHYIVRHARAPERTAVRNFRHSISLVIKLFNIAREQHCDQLVTERLDTIWPEEAAPGPLWLLRAGVSALPAQGSPSRARLLRAPAIAQSSLTLH